MHQDFPSTSQDLIRALKAPTDPPSGHAFSKIQMASQAWSRSTLYFPNKDQVIVDWILTRFLKEKDKPSSSNPVLDVDHWQLLSYIIHCNDMESSRRVKAWLTPLLNRTPLAPTLIAFLAQVPHLPQDIRMAVFTSFAPCFSVMWPLAKHKINVETLLECFSATLKIVCLDVNQELVQFHDTVFSAVSTTYLSALTRSPNRKKISSAFLSSHLELWLRCVPVVISCGLKDLYLVGVETLFAPETLRQLIDDPAINPVIQALSRIDPAILLPSLPTLLESFHECANRNRAGLFSHPQQTTYTIIDYVRASTVDFYNACDDLIYLPHDKSSDVWDARLQLLSVIEEKGAFSSAQPKVKSILSEKCRSAADELRSRKADRTELILNVICCFSRIDFELVSPYVTSVLPIVAKFSSSKVAAEFLELGLDHHKKTRTLPSYFSMVLDALEKATDIVDSGSPYDVYEAVLGGPIFDDSHVEKLRQALRGFVTPGQCLGFLTQTKETLERACSEHFRQQDIPDAVSSERSRKRRKLDPEPPTSSPIQAINFSFVCNIIAVVWSSLPIHSLTDESRSEVLNEIQGVNTSVIDPLLSAGVKRERVEEGGSGSRPWPRDIIMSSALRLQYSLSVCTPLGFHPTHDAKTESRMFRLLKAPDILPELKIEIGRSLLRSASLGTLKDVEALLERLLTCIESVDPPHNESCGKSFQLSRLDRSSRQLGVTLLHILSHRWLPTLSGAATAEDLQRFVRLLFSPIGGGHAAEDKSTQETGCFTAVTPLHSPAFWELQELRSAFLAYLSDVTSYLDVTDVVRTLENLPLSSNFSLDIRQIRSVYTLLRYTPMEYLPKSVRIDLAKKAVVFDGQLMSTLNPGSAHDGDLVNTLSLSREYISRSIVHGAVFDRLETDAVTKYLLDPKWSTSTYSPAFPSAITERLIGAHLNVVIKSYQPDDELGVLTILESAQPTAWSPQSVSRQTLLIVVLETIMRGSRLSKFSARVRQKLRSLFSSALEATAKQVTRLPSPDTLQEGDIVLLAIHLRLWCTLISLRIWTSNTDVPVPKLAAVVTGKILLHGARKTESASSWPVLYDHAVLASLSELSTVSVDEAPQASEIFLGIYLSLSHENMSPGMNNLVGGFMPSKSLPVHVFGAVLTKISELCSVARTNLVDVVSMIRLSEVLLRNAPEGTTKVTQKHITSSLHLFLNRQDLWYTNTCTSLEICRFISSVCTERPAALRPDDVMSTWTIISKLLSGSKDHDASTSTDIFHEIIGIASALIRHRRDLVLPGLPQLSAVLRRLVTMIRATRPGLGVKQARTVANSFPYWVNSGQPLGISEVKILSRLLVSLTTKTTVRLVGSTQENHKMESLARPFAKHASYVLAAYVQAMNDPLCVVYAGTRKELYPGLFALCEMLSDHDREAMVLSALDGGGKATMKTLWNDYKKQNDDAYNTLPDLDPVDPTRLFDPNPHLLFAISKVMSTDATSADKPVSSVGSTVTPNSAPVVDKGKGKGLEVKEEEDDDDDEEGDEDEMDEEDDDDDDDEDEFDEINPAVILPSGRRTRGIKVDYTSEEALKKAGLKLEEDPNEDGEDSFVHDDDAMKH